jgi:hypothetical protein
MARLSRGSSIQRPRWRGPHRELGAWVHGGPKPWGYALFCPDRLRDRTAEEASKRDAMARVPETGATRRRFAGSSPAQPKITAQSTISCTRGLFA